MKSSNKLGRFCINFLLAAGVVCAMTLLIEISLRLYYLRSPEVKGWVIPPGCPYVFGLNPGRSGVSRQGLRDREFAIPKPPNTRRILLLGDSVTYGMGVPPDSTFAKLLERKLNEMGQTVEVINTGVSAYTAYNEFQYYLHEGRKFQPDIVIVGFCMNDVVDPALHWQLQDRPSALRELSNEAIPNPELHEKTALPIIRRKARWAFLKHLALCRFLKIEDKIIANTLKDFDPKYVTVNGKRWPTYLVVEEAVDIRTLTDYHSPEWKWLRSIYDRLHAAVTADGATLAIMVFPVGYQLEEGYPFMPQELFRRYAEEASILLLDLLPDLKPYRDENLFMGRSRGEDVWHLSMNGHRRVAEALEAFINETHLLMKVSSDSMGVAAGRN